MRSRYWLMLLVLVCGPSYGVKDSIELKITTIKGNKELPKILYIVPWKEVKPVPQPQPKLELHSLFGDLFDPVLPQDY